MSLARFAHNWNIGLPWRELPGRLCCRCNTSEVESIELSPCKPACPGATRCGYTTVFTDYECLTFHHRILPCQVWARDLEFLTEKQDFRSDTNYDILIIMLSKIMKKKTTNMHIRAIPLGVQERINMLCRLRGIKRREFFGQARTFFEVLFMVGGAGFEPATSTV